MLEKARALRPMDGFIADSVGWAYFSGLAAIRTLCARWRKPCSWRPVPPT